MEFIFHTYKRVEFLRTLYIYKFYLYTSVPCFNFLLALDRECISPSHFHQRYNRPELIMDDSNGHDLMGPMSNSSRPGAASIRSMSSAPVYAPPHPQLAGHFAAVGSGAPPPAMAPAVYATGSVSRARSNAPALVALQPQPGHPPTYTQVVLAGPNGSQMRPTYIIRLICTIPFVFLDTN